MELVIFDIIFMFHVIFIFISSPRLTLSSSLVRKFLKQTNKQTIKQTDTYLLWGLDGFLEVWQITTNHLVRIEVINIYIIW